MPKDDKYQVRLISDTNQMTLYSGNSRSRAFESLQQARIILVQCNGTGRIQLFENYTVIDQWVVSEGSARPAYA